ncbi:hypothetical protein NUTIK01_05950 [Novosphingobium sp. IK01]|uniref:TIR domain-containing protein n=2 Tax=Novosphingobium pituita TaxID=3056842 RepID=A0ABQ6P3J8_9SPHN|nr:hypothetical protein NUTIK01_05950 [Novosphingobium sp. IK01]
MYPVFFSVASSDISFAEKIFDRIPDGHTYLYSKTGVDGAHLWDEISKEELPKSRLLIIFWSERYVHAQGCVQEILQARELVQQERIRPLVLRLDDYPIIFDETMDPKLEPVFEALKAMLGYRTSPASIDFIHATDLVQRAVEPLLRADHPQFPRLDLDPVWRTAIQKGRFDCLPVMWITGFNGVGRETLVRNFNRAFVPNGRGVLVEINETSLPNQVLLRVESEAFGLSRDDLKDIKVSTSETEIKALADAIERVFAAGDYVILKHARVIEENEELPRWLDDLSNLLAPSRRPKMFVISQTPVLGERRIGISDSAAVQRVPTISEYELNEFCYQLIGYFDKNPARWSDQDVQGLVKSAGGTIGFLVSLVRSSANVEDFDTIDQLIARDTRSMSTSITAYARWAFNQLRGDEDEQRVLGRRLINTEPQPH